jgi:CheY-like chemotaxis protein
LRLGSLPDAPHGAPSLPAAPLVRQTRLPQAPDNGGLVLIVEDSVVNQKIAARMLQRRGFHVEVVGNGQEAVDAVAARDFDLIFMDCQMPVMDGYEATRQIRTSGNSRIPIIALTANSMEGDREKCLAAGMTDYLSKPARPDELDRILSRCYPSADPGVAACRPADAAPV